MEDRYPYGILFVLTRCTDPAQEDDWNEWYNTMHVNDACSLGLLSNPTRYQNTGLHLNVNVGEARYLAVYETDIEDLLSVAQRQVQGHEDVIRRGRMHPAMDTTLATMYRRIGPEFRSSTEKREVRGLKLIMTECNDPTREEEFHHWYNNVHIPDILSTGLFHTAYRFENATPEKSPTTPRAGGSRFLTLYETDSDDPAKQADEILATWHPIWESRDRMTNLLELGGRAVFRKIWPAPAQ